MKKKSKGKTPQQMKMEQAHQKNLYLHKLKTVMDSISNEPAFHLLGSCEITTIYLSRIRPLKLKLEAIGGRHPSEDNVKYVNHAINKALKETMVEIDNEGMKINLYDFYVFVETIFLFWRNIQDDWFPDSRKFIEKFPLFTNGYSTKRVAALELVVKKLNEFAWTFTHIPEHITWIEPINKEPTGGEFDYSNFYNYYLVHLEAPETQILDIDGNKRSIYRIGIGTEKGIIWLTVTPERLGRHGIMDKFPLKVYIQKHAVERIKERLGEFFHLINFFLVSNAILDCEVYPAEESSILFSCKYNSIKVGYLKASIIGDKVLIRTFLFLTNNGTPEGKKLAGLLGVQKEDKKYLGIDKLSMFINSDIEQNENLKAIFRRAGCGQLFEIKKHLSDGEEHIIHCADSFSKYLQLEQAEDFFN